MHVLLIDKVFVSAGYNPCESVSCGAGECVVTSLPDPRAQTFPQLTYDTQCLCTDGSLRASEDGCVIGQCYVRMLTGSSQV